MPSGRVVWYEDTLTPGLMQLEVRGRANLHTLMEQYAQKAQDYAQENAPWEDRTGDARAGLSTEVYETGDVVGFILYHEVDYGIWLEVRWGGAYAIIIPTLEEIGPQLMQDLHTILDVSGVGLEFDE